MQPRLGPPHFVIPAKAGIQGRRRGATTVPAPPLPSWMTAATTARAARPERGVRSPLDDLGFTKADIREAARRMDLRVWDKPALAFRGNDEVRGGNDESGAGNDGSGATELARKVAGLQALLREMEHVVICFSGGVDSGYLLAEAVDALGDNALALTAVSPSLAPEEGADARSLALGGRKHRSPGISSSTPMEGSTTQLEFKIDWVRGQVVRNPVNRCYFLQDRALRQLVAIEEAASLGIAHVLDGFNVDDRGDHRPGRKAARERGVRSPLDELGFTKADIREAARRMGLCVWDKPALACLSSRFPYGTAITPEKLTQVNRCERVLRELGFRVYRVRYHDELARIEVAPGEFDEAAPTGHPRGNAAPLGNPPAFQGRRLHLRQHRPAQGYRSGSLNESVKGN